MTVKRSLKIYTGSVTIDPIL